MSLCRSCASSAGSDIDISAVSTENSFSLYAVARRCYIETSAGNVNKAERSIFCICSLYAVLTGIYGDISACGCNVVFGFYAVIFAVDCDISACDDDIVLAADTVAVIAVHCERTAAVYREAVLTENSGIGFVLTFFEVIAAAVRERIRASLCEGDEHLVCIGDVNSRMIA